MGCPLMRSRYLREPLLLLRDMHPKRYESRMCRASSTEIQYNSNNDERIFYIRIHNRISSWVRGS